MALNHKEMTKHIRSRLKIAKIPARCSLYTSCGIPYIKVSVDKELFEGAREWTTEQAYTIAHIADCNGLTGARSSKVDANHYAKLIGKHQFDFEFWG